jgi:hypothetical protein
MIFSVIKQQLNDTVTALLTAGNIIAFMLTIGIISMIMTSITPPDYFVVVWSMSVGYYFKGVQATLQTMSTIRTMKGNE